MRKPAMDTKKTVPWYRDSKRNRGRKSKVVVSTVDRTSNTTKIPCEEKLDAVEV